MNKQQIISISVILGIAVLLISFLIVYSIIFNSDVSYDISVSPSSGVEVSGGDYIQTSDDTNTPTTDSATTSTEVTADSTTVITTTDSTEASKTTETTQKETTTKKPTVENTTIENSTEYIDADISSWVIPSGDTIITRFKTPDGYNRVSCKDGSYSHYIQTLPLKENGSKIMLYDGTEKENQTWCAAVIDIPLSSTGWLQCADCVMKVIGDYLYNTGNYADLTFRLNNGFDVPFSKWANGYRLKVRGNKTSLEKTAEPDSSESTYLKYMVQIYKYANTDSLKSQSKKLSLEMIFPGSYFIMTKSESEGKPLGHAIMVADVAKNPETGDIAFLLAQGSTPSENMHVFLNPLHPDDPWYYVSEIGDTFDIPFRSFKSTSLYYLPVLLN